MAGPRRSAAEPSSIPIRIDVAELKQRLLAIQALESARCIEEGVVTDMREADVGSILGFGFAPFTGGTISYIDGMGTKAFVDLCSGLAKTIWGPFQAVASFCVDMAKKGETFYGRFPPEKRKAVRLSASCRSRSIAPLHAACKVAAHFSRDPHGA